LRFSGIEIYTNLLFVFRTFKNILYSSTRRLPYPSGLVQRRGRQERGDISRELYARNVAAVADKLHFEVDPVVQQPPRFYYGVVAARQHQQRSFRGRVCAKKKICIYTRIDVFTAFVKRHPTVLSTGSTPLTLEREVRAGYSDFVRVVLNDRTRLGHDVFCRVHRPNSEVSFHAAGHQITRIRTERNARNVFVVPAQLPTYDGKRRFENVQQISIDERAMDIV